MNIFCLRGCRITYCYPTLFGEHAFKNRPAIHSAVVFELAHSGNLAAEDDLDSPKSQLVDACHLLGAAYRYLMHAHSFHSYGRP